MCHWIAQNGGGFRRWRPEAGTCGPDMTYSGAKSRSGPQMFLNKGQTEKIKQQLPVREACRGVALSPPANDEGAGLANDGRTGRRMTEK